MPDLTATIPHRLSRAEAKRRIQDQLGSARRQYAGLLSDLRETWTGDKMAFSLTAMGQQVTGSVAVDDQSAHVTVALPWLLSALAGAIMPQIERQGRLLLASEKKEPETEKHGT
jgi:putative polyhydroxyalkanoate system protein